jgi:glycosyltransferase involved in cell wall biosynthesis
LSPQKNHSLLLKAWALLAPAIRETAQLAIVGDGPLRKTLLQEAENLGVGQSVIFPGHSENVATWYKAADLFVLASNYEGLSNAMLEAMSSGLPVVITAVGGHEWISADPECGFVTPIGDQRALAEALELLISDRNRRDNMGFISRQRIIDRASVRLVANDTLCVYHQLLRSGPINRIERTR